MHAHTHTLTREHAPRRHEDDARRGGALEQALQARGEHKAAQHVCGKAQVEAIHRLLLLVQLRVRVRVCECLSLCVHVCVLAFVYL